MNINCTDSARCIACTAQHILDGMNHHERWGQLQAVWEAAGMGFVEFTLWIADIAIHSECEVRKHEPQIFPGVYDYEVSFLVGEDIAQFMIATKNLPGENEWKAIFTKRFANFFEGQTS